MYMVRSVLPLVWTIRAGDEKVSVITLAVMPTLFSGKRDNISSFNLIGQYVPS